MDNVRPLPLPVTAEHFGPSPADLGEILRVSYPNDRFVLDATRTPILVDDGSLYVDVSESLDGRREMFCEIAAEPTEVEAMRAVAQSILAAADRLDPAL
ncbi:hypothetical protein O4157_20690 [Gordonia amicalis]|uniref:hypothetical protein n=1 Tax=Gordonia TaxID=2053 RepID=UPI0022B4C65F|nr:MULTISPECIES: hypothetical protein [Gordonia]MCZ4653827.1 hypothetical protein [Gordonia amicalis]WJG14460.1 hypothetical protein PWF70_05445 [Gordonia sp. Swx-4]